MQTTHLIFLTATALYVSKVGDRIHFVNIEDSVFWSGTAIYSHYCRFIMFSKKRFERISSEENLLG